MKIKIAMDCVSGSFDTDTDHLVCVGKRKYGEVLLCLKGDMNIPIALIKLHDSATFVDTLYVYDDAVRLGKEIVRRWNISSSKEWQSIATAPKGSGADGPQSTKDPDYVKPPNVLLWTGEGLEVGYYDWYFHEGYGAGAHERSSAWCNSCGDEIVPILWMPIPSPPDGNPLKEA